MFVLNLNKVGQKGIKQVGGKAASLGELLKLKLPVPRGFVITTNAYSKFNHKKLLQEFKNELFQCFKTLKLGKVAVRSSAIAEDSKKASWAGQLESYLNVDRKNLIDKIKKCWNSIKSERAVQYATQQNLSKNQLLVAVIVQAMIASEASGVMFTINPVTNNREEIMIEAGYGLGEMIVQGLITPNNFVLDKKTLEIKSKDIQPQDEMLVFQDGKNIKVKVPGNKKDEQAISDDQIKKLGKIAMKIENHYSAPQDIEWAIDSLGKIWILQSRPVTTT